MQPNIKNWIFYNIVVCFAVYWLSNLILWYPWSVNEKLGQILMLTINPVLWGVSSWACLKRYPGGSLAKGALLNSVIFTAEAITSDFIFFAILRHSTDKLLHATTFYGWAFVASVPFILLAIFRKRIGNNKASLNNKNFTLPIIVGGVSFIAIALILVFNVQFT